MKQITLFILVLMASAMLKPMDQNFLNQQAKLYVEDSLKKSTYNDIQQFLECRLEKSQSSLKIDKDYEILMLSTGDYSDDNYSKVFARQARYLCNFFIYNTCLKKYPENTHFKEKQEQAQDLSSLYYLDDIHEHTKKILTCFGGYNKAAAEKLVEGGFVNKCWCFYKIASMYFSSHISASDSNTEDPYENFTHNIMEDSYGKNYQEKLPLKLINSFSQECLKELELQKKPLDKE